MKYDKYYKDNNLIHIVNININELKNILDNINSIYSNNDNFIYEFNNRIKELNKDTSNINIRLEKTYNNHGNNILLNRFITQNINCYKTYNKNKTINIYYDLINKYNTNKDEIINRFVITYQLIKKLNRLGYNINFIPVLFLKAYDKLENNEYISVKFYDLNIDNILNYNVILNKEISSILLPEIIKLLDIKNKNELDYNGYLLERKEKENILNINDKDILIDIFTSDELFNGNIIHDKDVFYKKLILK